MVTINLGERNMDHSMWNWLLANIGPEEDAWSLDLNNNLIFKRGEDATYFTLMDAELKLGRRWRGI
jgi:hypothetical protein